MSETPWDELEQAPLWSEDDSRLETLRAQLDRKRAQWIEVRRRRAVGSAEEVEAWSMYRAASDLYWSALRRERGR